MANFVTIVARGENIVIYLSTDMVPRFLIKRRGHRERGNRYISFSSHLAPRPSPPPTPARSQPARLTRHTCCPAFLVTATVPQGAPSRRCTLAASSQTSSSAERRPAHPGELVRLAHRYRHIVGRSRSLRPPGKRCRLVSLIFALFSPWAGAKKCREAARQQAETGGKFPQCIPTTRDESAVRAADTH